MGKLIKILVSLLLILVLIVAALPFVIDPNDYRGEIIAAVEKNTGRQLSIEGDLGLSVFPWVGIDIGKMSLGNASGFGDKPFAAIEQASVRIKLMPLLGKEIVADTITLDGLQLNLARNAEGISNWADLAGTPSQDKAAADESTQQGFGLAGLAIGGFSINNATVHWHDATTGDDFQVKNFQLNSGAISPGEPVDLALGFDLQSAQPQMTARLSLEGTLAVDEKLETLSVQPLSIRIDADGEPFPSGSLQAELSTDVSVNLKPLAVELANLSVSSGDLQLQGNVSASDLDSQPAINGELQLAPLNLRQWLQAQGMALPAMASEQALSRFEASLQLKNAGSATRVENIDIRLDESGIKGNAGFNAGHIDFDLNIDQINVDNYLPKSAADDTPAPTPASAADTTASTPGDSQATAAADSAPLFPVETLRALDIKGSLGIGKLLVNRLTAEDYASHITATNGIIKSSNSIGRFYEGNFNSDSTLNVSGSTPKLAVTANLQNLQAGPLLRDLAEKDIMEGRGRFSMDINSSGNSVAALKQALGGNLDFRFEDGAVKGINLAKLLRETKAKFEGKTLPPSDEPEQTDFSELSGSAKISRGVINNQDLLAKSPFLRVQGAGTVDIVQEVLDYTVQTTIVATSRGQGGESLTELEGLNIPVRLTGPYTAPKYSVDWGKVLLSSQKAKLKEKLQEKVQQKLQDNVEEKAKDDIKKKLGEELFKGLGL